MQMWRATTAVAFSGSICRTCPGPGYRIGCQTVPTAYLVPTLTLSQTGSVPTQKQNLGSRHMSFCHQFVRTHFPVIPTQWATELSIYVRS